jgi:agmatinase
VATPGAYAGIATFSGLPLAIYPEDLVAGDVDIAIMGAPIDLSGGRRGAAWGPRYLRMAEQYIPHCELTRSLLSHNHTMVQPGAELVAVDYGDAGIHPFSTEESHKEVRKRVREIVEVGAIPFIMGGDHSLMLPDVAALADVYGAGNVGVIHFDAHYDAAANQWGYRYAHGTMVYNLIDEEGLLGKNFIQVGLRGWAPMEGDMAWMRDQGIKSHYMAEIERDGFGKVMERAIAEAMDGPEYLFVSFDIDTLDPSFAPGTGTPEPGGLYPREVFPIVRRLCAECNVVGFELVEVAPLLDPTYVTSYNGAQIISEAMTGIAMRKKGITEPWYLDPRTSGRDPVSGQRTD